MTNLEQSNMSITKDFRAFSTLAEAYDFIVVDIPADGNCFFSAIVH